MARLPTQMHAFVLTGHGGFDKLEYRDDWPTPQAQKGEVVIRVAACGLNNTDINTRTAWYSEPVTEGITDQGGKTGFDSIDAASGNWSSSKLIFPRIQGADVAGYIVAVGETVNPARIGERVLVDPWILATGDWMDTMRSGYFGSECDGGFAQYSKVHGENAIAIHSDLSGAELATFPCAYTTAENLVSRTGLKPGETVVIAGASGGVGSAAIQLCRLRGARVIAIAASSKAQSLIDLGADSVIDRDTVDLVTAIQDAANGPVDVALDVVGGKMFPVLIESLRQSGRYASSGAIAGPVIEFDLRQLIYKDLQLSGATIVPPGTMLRVVRLIEQGLLKPLLAQSFALRDLVQAQTVFLEKKHIGSIVVTNEVDTQ